jgi:hypothetical protein
MYSVHKSVPRDVVVHFQSQAEVRCTAVHGSTKLGYIRRCKLAKKFFVGCPPNSRSMIGVSEAENERNTLVIDLTPLMVVLILPMQRLWCHIKRKAYRDDEEEISRVDVRLMWQPICCNRLLYISLLAGEHVVSLDLGNNAIKNVDGLKQLPCLISLSLASNQIARLPAAEQVRLSPCVSPQYMCACAHRL